MSTKANMEGVYADTDALVGLVFALSGKFSEPHAAFTSLIKRNAADVKASITKAVTHLVSTVSDFETKSTKVQKAMAQGIPIVTEQWVRESIEANEALPLRPDLVLHPGNKPLIEPDVSTKLKASPRTASIDEGRKAEQEAATAAEDVIAGVPPVVEARIDESRLPSTLLTQAEDASLPILHLPALGPSHPLPSTEKQSAPTEPISLAPPAPSASAPREPTPAEETARIFATAAAEIPPVPTPTHETLVRAAAPDAMQEEEEAATIAAAAAAAATTTTEARGPGAAEKRKVEETQAEVLSLPGLEEPPHKRLKVDEEKVPVSAASETQLAPAEMTSAEVAAPMEAELQSALPAAGEAGNAAVLPPSQGTPLPGAMEISPSGAETGGPSAMQVTQRTYDIKVLERKEHGPSTAHELSGLLEKQLLEGINVHNESTTGFGSVADVLARGVDGGAVLVESVRDYHGQDYYTIITYGRGGKEFGSVHRNDEILSCGLMRAGRLSAVRSEDAELMERLMHVHLPIIPVATSSS